MYRIGEVYKRDRDTYYNFATKERVSCRPRELLFLLIAIAATLFISRWPSDALDALLTIYAILVGFGFSMLFYLATNQIAAASQDASLEEQLRTERRITLRTELFFNVSYFNVVALFCVGCAFLFLLPPPVGLSPSLWKAPELARSVWRNVSTGGAIVVELLLYLTLFESAFTFARLVGRASFLFERELKAAKG